MRFLKTVGSTIVVLLCVFIGLVTAVTAGVLAAIAYWFRHLIGRPAPIHRVRDPGEDQLWRKGNVINVTPTEVPTAPTLPK